MISIFRTRTNMANSKRESHGWRLRDTVHLTGNSSCEANCGGHRSGPCIVVRVVLVASTDLSSAGFPISTSDDVFKNQDATPGNAAFYTGLLTSRLNYQKLPRTSAAGSEIVYGFEVSIGVFLKRCLRVLMRILGRNRSTCSFAGLVKSSCTEETC